MLSDLSCSRYKEYKPKKAQMDTKSVVKMIIDNKRLINGISLSLQFVSTILTIGDAVVPLIYELFSVIYEVWHEDVDINADSATIQKDKERAKKIYTGIFEMLMVMVRTTNLAVTIPIELERSVRLRNPNSNFIDELLNIRFTGDFDTFEKRCDELFTKEFLDYSSYDIASLWCVLIQLILECTEIYDNPITRYIVGEPRKYSDVFTGNIPKENIMIAPDIYAKIKEVQSKNVKNIIAKNNMILDSSNFTSAEAMIVRAYSLLAANDKGEPLYYMNKRELHKLTGKLMDPDKDIIKLIDKKVIDEYILRIKGNYAKDIYRYIGQKEQISGEKADKYQTKINDMLTERFEVIETLTFMSLLYSEKLLNELGVVQQQAHQIDTDADVRKINEYVYNYLNKVPFISMHNMIKDEFSNSVLANMQKNKQNYDTLVNRFVGLGGNIKYAYTDDMKIEERKIAECRDMILHDNEAKITEILKGERTESKKKLTAFGLKAVIYAFTRSYSIVKFAAKSLPSGIINIFWSDNGSSGLCNEFLESIAGTMLGPEYIISGDVQNKSKSELVRDYVNYTMTGEDPFLNKLMEEKKIAVPEKYKAEDNINIFKTSDEINKIMLTTKEQEMNDILAEKEQKIREEIKLGGESQNESDRLNIIKQIDAHRNELSEVRYNFASNKGISDNTKRSIITNMSSVFAYRVIDPKLNFDKKSMLHKWLCNLSQNTKDIGACSSAMFNFVLALFYIINKMSIVVNDRYTEYAKVKKMMLPQYRENEIETFCKYNSILGRSEWAKTGIYAMDKDLKASEKPVKK